MIRMSGILLPVFSLPSHYGIGTMGKEAYRWIDYLKKCNQKVWQVLPLGPTGFGDSPYQSFSSFAGNPYFIDLDILKDEKLLKNSDLKDIVWCKSETKVDYSALYNERFKILRKAFSRFEDKEALDDFKKENKWVRDYALFMALKDANKGSPWYMWQKGLKKRNSSALKKAREELKNEIDFYTFIQYEFFKQWKKLKSYANSKGIKILGDLPIYAAMDSCDVWKDPKQFYLDEELCPVEVAGVPPDGFTEDGQLWGNPLYRWDVMEENNFKWWKERLSSAFKLFDILRIDHFRGLESYYAVPAGEETARNGRWRKGPGKKFIQFLKDSFKDKEIIAEDLGYLTEDVHELLSASGFPGMKVMHFAFDGDMNNLYLPHNYEKNCVVYTGTHDNDTTVGWLHSAYEYQIENAEKYLGTEEKSYEEFTEAMVESALKSCADLAIVPMQDYLLLGSEARINTPSTDRGNWMWRMEGDYDKKAPCKKLAALVKKSNR